MITEALFGDDGKKKSPIREIIQDGLVVAGVVGSLLLITRGDSRGSAVFDTIRSVRGKSPNTNAVQ